MARAIVGKLMMGVMYKNHARAFTQLPNLSGEMV
jgi:hypothetical protein